MQIWHRSPAERTGRPKLGQPDLGDVNTATVSPKTLTFTTENWNEGQTVTVTGVPDSDSVHEHLLVLAKVSIASGADTDDPYRNPERVNGVWVTI